MKKTLGILFVSCLFLTYSCSGNKKLKEDILGKWEFESMRPEIVETSDPETSMQIRDIYTNDASFVFKNLVEFLQDGKYVDLSQNMLGSKKTEGTYTIDNSDVKITQNGVTITKKISTLKDDKLVLIENATEFEQEKYPDAKIKKVTFSVTYKKID